MLWKRIITAIIGIPAVIFIIWEGNILLWLSVIVLTVLIAKEITEMLLKNNITTFSFLIYLFSIVIITQSFFYKDIFLSELLFMIIAIFSVIAILQKHTFESIIYSLFILLYVPFLLRYLILVRIESGEGFQLLLLLFLLIWLYDTSAYFTGKKFGTKKLLPNVSPNKTIEGTLGGLIVTIIFSVFLSKYMLDLNILYGIVLGITISVFGQLGDLFESLLKRCLNMKDSGGVLPGHGGLLDRFDSLLFAAPASYIVLKLLAVI